MTYLFELGRKLILIVRSLCRLPSCESNLDLDRTQIRLSTALAEGIVGLYRDNILRAK